MVLGRGIQVGESSWEGLAGGRRKGLRRVPGSFGELLEGEGGMSGISEHFLRNMAEGAHSYGWER